MRYQDGIQFALATLAACLTVYLSSSAHHSTSKDSAFLAPASTQATQPVISPKHKGNPERETLLQNSQPTVPSNGVQATQPARKVMFYAAGSGIPEIKTILSGLS